MGLDMSCYSNVKPATDGHDIPDGESWCEADDHVKVYAYSGFTHALTGVAAETTVTNTDLGGGMLEVKGCYDTSESEYHGFRAGSYGGYNAFREELANMVGRSAGHYWGGDGNPDWPFYELVNFADNEGTLDWVCAKALLDDFLQYRDEFARRNPPEKNWWLETYDDWITGLRLAADHGLVVFH